jgi:tellurite resistance protein TerC
MDVSPLFWVLFNILIIFLLLLDLGILNRNAKIMSFKQAARNSVIWISLAMLFNVGLYFIAGPEKGLEFLTGYLIEYSLSVDNIFVFVLIFSSFAVPREYQYRVLFWGIIGALLLRGTLIFAGAALVERFHWVLYIFGAFLVFAGLRLLFGGNEEETIDIENNRIIKFIRRFIPLTDTYHQSFFFVMQQGKRMATPLFLVLIFVDIIDVVFALDSIPAIFAVTKDPFIVYTSNVFAILGLRSLYFLLEGIVNKFVHLRYGLAVVLTFVGLKLLLEQFIHISNLVSLLVIVLAIGISIYTSLHFGQKDSSHKVIDEV